jgi:mono/diheme cytochrome c family protein
LARWKKVERARPRSGRAARRSRAKRGPPRRIALALALAAAAAPARADDRTLAFRRHGEAVASRDLTALTKLARAETVRVFEPYEQHEVAFLALRFDAVLDALYGTRWRSEEELLFTCRDGYQPTVPVARVLAHRAWLAFERAGTPFTIKKFESGRVQEVSLAPFYLIWENLADSTVRAEGDYGWPYQLVGVELIRARDHFPQLVPPADASPAAQRGFREFRIHCSRCHPLNGEGGGIGPELNAAANPAGRRDPAWLRRWIDAPSRIAPTARMEALSPTLPDRDAVLDAIVAYLQAMADAPRAEPRRD